jgi:hypothetical protein
MMIAARRLLPLLAIAGSLVIAAPATASTASTGYCPRCFFIVPQPYFVNYTGDLLGETIVSRPINAAVVEYDEQFDLAISTPGCLPKLLTTRCDVRLTTGLYEGGPKLPDPTGPATVWTEMVDGGAGNDTLLLTGDPPSPWSTVVRGGDGDDRIEAPLRRDARIFCGAGYDVVVANVAATFAVPSDCESVTLVS